MTEDVKLIDAPAAKDEDSIPYPGATRANDALRELIVIMDAPDREVRRQALSGWWRRWTATAGAMSYLDPESMRVLAERADHLAVRENLRHETILRLLGKTPLAFHEDERHDQIDGSILHLSSISILLAKPNPKADPSVLAGVSAPEEK